MAKALAVDFDRFEFLPAGDESWATAGPMAPRNALILAGWFMLREVEVANLRADCVVVKEGRQPTVTFTLPSSKADQEALGVRRTHTCICREVPRPMCPAHAAWDQRLRLQRRFPQHFRGETVDATLPFFPTQKGQAITKAGFLQTLLYAARDLQVPVADDLVNVRVTGHSLRATGAQHLAQAGLDVYTIQLLGRWGSRAVEGYVREAVLHGAACRARAAQLAKTIDRYTGEVADAAPDKFDKDFVTSALRGILIDPLSADILDMLADKIASRLRQRSAPPATSSGTSTSSSEASAPSPPASPSCGHRPPSPSCGHRPPRSHAEEPPLEIGQLLGCVSNAKGRTKHSILVGPPHSEVTAFVTSCGWKYGHSRWARWPDEGDAECAKCFPLG